MKIERMTTEQHDAMTEWMTSTSVEELHRLRDGATARAAIEQKTPKLAHEAAQAELTVAFYDGILNNR